MPEQTNKPVPNAWRYEHFAALALNPDEISLLNSVDWEYYDEDGLGRAAFAGFHLPDGGYYMLRHLFQAPVPATTIMLDIDSAERETLINSICDDFGFRPDDIIWTSEALRGDFIVGGPKSATETGLGEQSVPPKSDRAGG